MHRSLVLAALVLMAATAALGQDPVKVDPKHCKVEFENAQVRVLRWKTGPHEKIPMHGHPAYVSISLTNGHTRYTFPDGTTKDVQTKAGETSWTAPEKHSAENLLDQSTESLQVELKARAPSTPAKKK